VNFFPELPTMTLGIARLPESITVAARTFRNSYPSQKFIVGTKKVK
jgi:hypothetical protein